MDDLSGGKEQSSPVDDYVNFLSQGAGQNPPAGQAKPKDETVDDYVQFLSGEKNAPKGKTETALEGISDDEKAYRQQIEGYMPEARKRVKEIGLPSAVLYGDYPILTSNVVGAGLDVQALFDGKGNDYTERRRDLGAREEALQRAAGEAYPWTKFTAELAGGAALPLGVGSKVAQGAGALGKAAIYGAEGAGLGAATAASEKVGTKPVSEQPDIESSAVTGGILGSGLSLFGSGVAKTWSKLAPDWLQSFTNDSVAKQIASRIAKNEADGTATMTVDEAKRAIANGQDVTVFDLLNSEDQQWLKNRMKGRTDALDGYNNVLEQRLAGADDRFDNALKSTLGTTEDLNLADMSKKSEDYAKQLNNENYAKALTPENGRGVWNPQWEEQFRDSNAVSAAKGADKFMSDLNFGQFQSPLGRVGSTSIDTLGLSAPAKSALQRVGVNTLDDVASLGQTGLKDIFTTPAKAPSLIDALSEEVGLPKDFLASMSDKQLAALAKTNNVVPKAQPATVTPEAAAAIREINGAMMDKNLNRLTLTNPDSMNTQWLNAYQQNLWKARQDLKAGGSQNTPFVNRMDNYRNEIVQGLKGPTLADGSKNPYYNPATYNPAFEEAHNFAAQDFREKGAFTTGMEFYKQLNDGLRSSKMLQNVNKMNPEEQNQFAQGILAQMKFLATETGKPLDYNKLRKWFGNTYVTGALRKTLGDEKFYRLQDFVKAESVMQQSLGKLRDLEKSAQSGDRTRIGIFSKDAALGGLSWLIDSKAPILGVFYNHVIAPYFGYRLAKQLRSQLESGDMGKLSSVMDRIMANPNAKSALMHTMQRLGVMTALHSNSPGAQHMLGLAEEHKRQSKPAIGPYASGGFVSEHPANMVHGVHVGSNVVFTGGL